MVNFLLKVVLRADDLSRPTVKTSHHTSLHMGRIMGLQVEIPVRVRGLPVDKDVQAAILSPSDVEEQQYPVLFPLHNELDDRPDPIEMV